MLTTLLVAFIALEHIGFAVLEMVLWTRPFGRRTFGLSAEEARLTAPLALNQGVYNLFLAAGLITSLVIAGPTAFAFQVFFLACVVVAGIVGGATAKRTILFVQAVPAAIALALALTG